MKPIDFPQRNLMLAEDQPEYETLPVFCEYMPYKPEEKIVPIKSMTAVYELSDEEIAEVIANKKIFYRQYIFGHQFQPMFISTKDPFVHENKEHWPAEL